MLVFIPKLRNKTLYDYNVNLLRTTSECMSAILGGANTISNVSYDAIYHKFDMIELDIQLDKEDNIIIFHDQFIGTTPVNNMTIQEIRSNYPDILLLSTFFELFNYKQIRLYFDMKGSEKLSIFI